MIFKDPSIFANNAAARMHNKKSRPFKKAGIFLGFCDWIDSSRTKLNIHSSSVQALSRKSFSKMDLYNWEAFLKRKTFLEKSSDAFCANLPCIG